MPLYKRPGSPFWYVRLGRKTRESTGTEVWEDAREYEETLKRRLWRLEHLGDRGAIRFDEAASRWLNSTTRPKNRDREIVAWLQPKIGHEMVADVADPDALEEIRKDGLAQGWSHSTVDRAMGTISAILHDCVKRRNLESAPMVPMFRPPASEPNPLTPEEVDRLCSHSMMHQALAIRVAVHTMLRMRAMLQLTKDRVNLTERRAWVPRAHQKAGRTFALPLNSEAVRALRALWLMSPRSSPYIFTWNGKPIDDCNTAAFQEACKAAGLGRVRWHDLRHTGASWAVQNGVTLPELMVLGDWRDYRSVLRYAHLAPSHAASAADRVAQWAHSGSATRNHENRRKAS